MHPYYSRSLCCLDQSLNVVYKPRPPPRKLSLPPHKATKLEDTDLLFQKRGQAEKVFELLALAANLAEYDKTHSGLPSTPHQIPPSKSQPPATNSTDSHGK